MKARISTLTRKVEELEGKRLHEVQAVTENPEQANPCTNFQSTAHPEEHYPMAPFSKGFDVRICKCRRSIQATTT